MTEIHALFGTIRITDAIENHSMYSCSHCDSQYLKWQGRCSECGKWGTLSESSDATQSTNTKANDIKEAPSAPVLDFSSAASKPVKHISTKIDELDRVLSGGLVAGSVTLLAGEPGVGKSTLVAQIASIFPGNPLYVSGEESQGQIMLRFERLGITPKNLKFSNSVETGSIIRSAKEASTSLLIIDSIQTMIPHGNESTPGSPNAVRTATAQLIELAKSTNIPVLIIGQVTKEGNVAGPKTLEHLVDTVLTLEGDTKTSYRILRANKHRFGTTDEVGIFEMTEKGMSAVENPSQKFLEERQVNAGSVITCVMEGTRPFLVEIQALAEKSHFANPIRRTSGFDSGRLQMLLAIISKRAGVKVGDQDIYVNVVGGIKVKETAVDLAVATAILSSVKEKIIPADTVVLGELGLGGEVRNIPFLDRRLKEAKRLGFKNSLSPKNTKNLKEVL